MGSGGMRTRQPRSPPAGSACLRPDARWDAVIPARVFEPGYTKGVMMGVPLTVVAYSEIVSMTADIIGGKDLDAHCLGWATDAWPQVQLPPRGYDHRLPQVQALIQSLSYMMVSLLGPFG